MKIVRSLALLVLVAMATVCKTKESDWPLKAFFPVKLDDDLERLKIELTDMTPGLMALAAYQEDLNLLREAQMLLEQYKITKDKDVLIEAKRKGGMANAALNSGVPFIERNLIPELNDPFSSYTDIQKNAAQEVINLNSAAIKKAEELEEEIAALQK